MSSEEEKVRKFLFKRAETGEGRAQCRIGEWRGGGSHHSGRGDISQFTSGVHERGGTCLCVMLVEEGLPVPLGEGGRLPPCHRNSSKHFLVTVSKKTTRLFSYTR